jgi:hypothetical protein
MTSVWPSSGRADSRSSRRCAHSPHHSSCCSADLDVHVQPPAASSAALRRTLPYVIPHLCQWFEQAYANPAAHLLAPLCMLTVCMMFVLACPLQGCLRYWYIFGST